MDELIEKPPPDEWAWPQGTRGAIGIYLRMEDLRDIFVRSCASASIAGALIGEAFRWDGRTYVEIQSHVPFASGASHLAPSAWDELAHAMEQRASEGPAESVVGWFFSQPGQGIFLTGDVVQLHRSRFHEPWQVVLVIDPVRQTMGFFHPHGATMKACGFNYIGKP
jgi:hypothetical protein